MRIFATTLALVDEGGYTSASRSNICRVPARLRRNVMIKWQTAGEEGGTAAAICRP